MVMATERRDAYIAGYMQGRNDQASCGLSQNELRLDAMRAADHDGYAIPTIAQHGHPCDGQACIHCGPEHGCKPHSTKLSDALNYLETWAIGGNKLEGDDVERFRATADRIAPKASAQGEAVAWMRKEVTYRGVDGRGENERIISEYKVYSDDIPLYTYSAERAGVTKSELQQLIEANGNFSLSESPDLWPEWIHRAIAAAVEDDRQRAYYSAQGEKIATIGSCSITGPKVDVDHLTEIIESQYTNPAVAAIQFTLTSDEGIAFLRCWNEGNFEACRREWPEAPQECYIGADPELAVNEKA